MSSIPISEDFVFERPKDPNWTALQVRRTSHMASPRRACTKWERSAVWPSVRSSDRLVNYRTGFPYPLSSYEPLNSTTALRRQRPHLHPHPSHYRPRHQLWVTLSSVDREDNACPSTSTAAAWVRCVWQTYRYWHKLTANVTIYQILILFCIVKILWGTRTYLEWWHIYTKPPFIETNLTEFVTFHYCI